MKRVMIDLETWSTLPNAAILSIGAVEFDEDYNTVSSFYANVDPKSCKVHHMHFSESTMDFWRTNTAAYAQTKENRISIEDAVEGFQSWLGNAEKTQMWANGVAFDFPIIENAIRCTTGKEATWKFWNVMDARTLYKIAGLNTKTWQSRSGTFHNAVDDCITQIDMLKHIFK